VSTAPCPHARPDSRLCPHCLGVNPLQPLLLGTTTATGGPFVIGDASTVEYMRKHAAPLPAGDDAALREEIAGTIYLTAFAAAPEGSGGLAMCECEYLADAILAAFNVTKKESA
jgi:hypothetical protein